MKQFSMIILACTAILSMQAAYGQADSLKRFTPTENGAADKRFKKEIEQKQLNRQPRLLPSSQKENAAKPVATKSKTKKKNCLKRKHKHSKSL